MDNGKIEQKIIVSIDCMDWIPSIPVPAQFGVNWQQYDISMYYHQLNNIIIIIINQYI